MRIIGSVKAKFNCALKILYSEQLMKNAEDAGISADQWGGRKNRDAIACVTRRRLTWDYIKIRKVTAFVGAAYATLCFDTVDRPYVTIMSRKKGMSSNICKCASLVVKNLEHSVKISAGPSQGACKEEKGDTKLSGIPQGTAHIMARQALVSHNPRTLQDGDAHRR